LTRTSLFSVDVSSGKTREIIAAAAVHVRRHMRTEEELNRISEEIIGCAIRVHRRIGPGCLESAYVPCLALEMQRRKLDFRREVALTLRYDELIVPRAYVTDFIVEDCVVGEVKAEATVVERHRRQVQTYLEISGCPLGLILNFGALKLIDGIKRVVNNFPYGSPRLSGNTYTR
jgi:GxxExxY protein